jgi:hypothetical protein
MVMAGHFPFGAGLGAGVLTAVVFVGSFSAAASIALRMSDPLCAYFVTAHPLSKGVRKRTEQPDGSRLAGEVFR